MAHCVEIRVVTYRRPRMLRRALKSLLAQSHRDWRAIVLDDSPDREGRAVVTDIADDRIQYQPNLVNLGCAANIDLAFRREPFIKTSTHACILEDDNFFEEEFLTDNLELMEANGVRLLLRNQWIFWDNGMGVRKTSETCRSGFFENGLLYPDEILPHLPFHCGISNGGLMWRLDYTSDMVVGNATEDPSLQEIVRTFQVREPLYYADTPLAWFRAEEKGWQPGKIRNIRSLRAAQSVALQAVKRGPSDFWEQATRLAERHGEKHWSQLDRFALMALNWRHKFRTLSRHQALVKLIKHGALRCIMNDPLGAYWRQTQ